MNYSAFNATVPRVCRDLMHDFPGLVPDDTFAICGNLGHESAGFTAFQEIRPTVSGSAGGWGWAQWTGMSKTGRRYLFNAWCAAQGISDLRSYEANYGFLRHELQTTYKRCIASLKAAASLQAKVDIFERQYEGAGVPALASRLKWAERARDAYNKVSDAPAPTVPAPSVPPAPTNAPVSPSASPKPAPEAPKAPTKQTPQAPKVSPKSASGTAAGLSAILAAFMHSWWLGAAVAAAVLATIIMVVVANSKK